MKIVDILILSIFSSVCIFSTYVSYLVRYEDYNRYFTFIPSLGFMLIFSYASRYGKMPLYEFSAWYNAIGAFTGIFVMHFLGEKITLTQSFGVLLLCVSLFIINYKTL
jgi:hypothetical protein